MPVAIDATVGGATSNSFVLLAEATAYMESRLNGSTWTAATTDNQNRALVEATRELSSRTWKGSRVDSTQALSWPRQWVEDPDAPLGTFVSSTAIPQRIKDATCELAFQFINAGTTDIASIDPTVGVRSKTVDVLTTEYEPSQRPQGLRRFSRIWNYIAPFLAESSGVTRPLVRG